MGEGNYDGWEGKRRGGKNTEAARRSFCLWAFPPRPLPLPDRPGHGKQIARSPSPRLAPRAKSSSWDAAPAPPRADAEPAEAHSGPIQFGDRSGCQAGASPESHYVRARFLVRPRAEMTT